MESTRALFMWTAALFTSAFKRQHDAPLKTGAPVRSRRAIKFRSRRALKSEHDILEPLIIHVSPTFQHPRQPNLPSIHVSPTSSALAAVHAIKPGSLHLLMPRNIRSCVEFHCLPLPSSHRSNIVSFLSGCLLLKPLPQTV